jgi:hypothetical protein
MQNLMIRFWKTSQHGCLAISHNACLESLWSFGSCNSAGKQTYSNLMIGISSKQGQHFARPAVNSPSVAEAFCTDWRE